MILMVFVVYSDISIELMVLVFGDSRQMLVEYLCLKIRNISSQELISLQCDSGMVMWWVICFCEVLVLCVVFFSFGFICSSVEEMSCRLQVIYIMVQVSQMLKMVLCRVCSCMIRCFCSQLVIGSVESQLCFSD